MSLIDCCERIGIELQETKEGRNAIQLFDICKREISDISGSIYYSSIERYHFSYHFYAPQITIDLLKSNVTNEIVGKECKSILEHKIVFEYAESMVPMGKLVDSIANTAFQLTVPYSMPKEITATPKLIRLVQNLSLECQRLDIGQKLIAQNKIDKQFTDLVKSFDRLARESPAVSYSKKDRKIAKELISQGYIRSSVELVYTFMSILSLIKTTIYAGFFNKIVSLYAESDVLDEKQKRIGSLDVIRLRLCNNLNTIDLNEKWILRYIRGNGEIKYGQIYTKTTHFSRGCANTTIHALMYNIL